MKNFSELLSIVFSELLSIVLCVLLSLTLMRTCTEDDEINAYIFIKKYFDYAPELPVEVSTRDSFFFGGKVLQIRNKSNKTLECRLMVRNFESGERVSKRKAVVVTLSPNETREFGILEMDWRFEPGEEVYIESDGYRGGVWKIGQ